MLTVKTETIAGVVCEVKNSGHVVAKLDTEIGVVAMIVDPSGKIVHSNTSPGHTAYDVVKGAALQAQSGVSQ